MTQGTVLGPSYSIASCVIEAAQRLQSTPADDNDTHTSLRAAGRGLMTAEVLAFRELPDPNKKRRLSQGMEIVLGFYDHESLRAVEKEINVVRETIGFAVGGYAWGIEIRLTHLLRDTNWLGSLNQWPDNRPYQHLDRISNPSKHLLEHGDFGTLLVIARRIRYRLGIDHAGGATDIFWWTTLQTESWIARFQSKDAVAELDRNKRREFNYAVGDLATNSIKISANVDPVYASPDNWGFVDIERDPVSVVTLGPYSNLAETHHDIKTTLQLAGNQLTVTNQQLTKSERGLSDPGILYAEALEKMADGDIKRRELDVLIVYRGGVSSDRNFSKRSCQRILDACGILVSKGVEVVLGIGHGATSIHGIAGAELPVGVFEAVTPTAAAAWVIKEHVNRRLMERQLDPGQP